MSAADVRINVIGHYMPTDELTKDTLTGVAIYLASIHTFPEASIEEVHRQAVATCNEAYARASEDIQLEELYHGAMLARVMDLIMAVRR